MLNRGKKLQKGKNIKIFRFIEESVSKLYHTELVPKECLIVMVRSTKNSSL